MTMTSGEMFLPSETDFSRFCLTLRRSASCSGGSSSGDCGSSRRVILALRYGSSARNGVDARAGESLDEQADAPVGQLEHAHDRRDGADRVELVGPRRLVLRRPSGRRA